MNRSEVPLLGRVIGWAVALMAVAGAVRVAWQIVEPVLPSLSVLVATLLLLRWLVRGRR